MVQKLNVLVFAFFILLFQSFAQDVPEVTVAPEENQTEATINQDKEECLNNAEEEWEHSEHKTLKNTGVGVGAGAVIGEIFGKPGIGAIAGGAAGAYRGHTRSKEDQQEFNNIYASCLRDKGYSVEVHED